ncbi:MAG: sigma-70 family RNA polymerase sigma factor [Ilumatobacteraceae bacterium]
MAYRSGDSEADLLRRYVHEVEAHPRLTPEEQADFVAHASTDHTGAHEARRRLIQSHLRIVVQIAHRLEHRGVPLLDLIQEGNLGLMRAVDRLEEGVSVDFDAAVRWHVRQAMARLLHDAGSELDRELDAAYDSFEPGDAATEYPPYDPGFPTGSASSASSPDHASETHPSLSGNVRALHALPGGGSATRSGRELAGEPAPYDLVADQLEREALELQLDWLSPASRWC